MKALLAVDIRDGHAASVVAHAAPWAERLGAVVDLAFVSPMRDLSSFMSDPYVTQVMEAEAKRLREADERRLVELLASLPLACRGRGRLESGTAATRLGELSAEYECLLIATHGRKGLAQFWLGSIAEQVVRRASCAVVVLRVGESARVP